MKSLITLVLAIVGLSFTAVAAEEALALDGYCPVCYLSAGKAVKGTKEFAAEHDGKTYYFVHADAMKAFQADPEKFLPQYGGLCAYGMALGKKFESDPTVFTIADDKVYLNKDASIGKEFKKDVSGNIVKADAEWKKLMMAEKEAMMKKEKMKK